jgi:hypothetical protein
MSNEQKYVWNKKDQERASIHIFMNGESGSYLLAPKKHEKIQVLSKWQTMYEVWNSIHYAERSIFDFDHRLLSTFKLSDLYLYL